MRKLWNKKCTGEIAIVQYSIDSMTDICKQMLATTKVHKIETATVQYLIDGIPPATAAAAVVPDAASKAASKAIVLDAAVHNIETAIVQYSIDGTLGPMK